MIDGKATREELEQKKEKLRTLDRRVYKERRALRKRALELQQLLWRNTE